MCNLQNDDDITMKFSGFHVVSLWQGNTHGMQIMRLIKSSFIGQNHENKLLNAKDLFRFA